MIFQNGMKFKYLQYFSLCLLGAFYLIITGCGKPSSAGKEERNPAPSFEISFNTTEELTNLRLLDVFNEEMKAGNFKRAQEIANQMAEGFLEKQEGHIRIDFYGVCSSCNQGMCNSCSGRGRCSACSGSQKCTNCNGNHTHVQDCRECICRRCNETGGCTVCGASGQINCQQCNGSGIGAPIFTRCNTCNGTGKYRFSTGRVSDCNQCNGQGRRVAGHNRCGSCNGSRRTSCSTCRGNGRCTTCGGSKRTANCGMCGGDGNIVRNCPSCAQNPGKCTRCNGSGNCIQCLGTGKCELISNLISISNSISFLNAYTGNRVGVYRKNRIRFGDYTQSVIEMYGHKYQLTPSPHSSLALIGMTLDDFFDELKRERNP